MIEMIKHMRTHNGKKSQATRERGERKNGRKKVVDYFDYISEREREFYTGYVDCVSGVSLERSAGCIIRSVRFVLGRRRLLLLPLLVAAAQHNISGILRRRRGGRDARAKIYRAHIENVFFPSIFFHFIFFD
jgi:hypothetical protein